MCGLTGFISKGKSSDSSHVLASMSETLVHRGPDSCGDWIDLEQGVYLAHRRLSILDLSEAGHQPMVSASGRYVITFNGEIYNFQDLRKELEKAGIRFIGSSDTEVLLASIEYYGIEESLTRINGMFAFAVWDRENKQLVLARDRLGEKPLYYGWQRDSFLFGSELKSLRRHPSWCNEINRDAITLLLHHNFIPAPHSIYKNIYKLCPGRFLTYSLNNDEINTETYWDASKIYQKHIYDASQKSFEEITDELESKLKQVIKRQIISDVPVGAFLSGGIDSSTVVSLMQEISSQNVKTFTIGFGEKEYNEAGYARQISDILGTEHTEMYVSPEDSLGVIPGLSQIYDEPFADSSQIPSYLICKLAKEKVTVVLSGDGGDELFCGYDRYRKTVKHWQKMNRVPAALRCFGSEMAINMPKQIIDEVGRLAEIIGGKNSVEFYRRYILKMNLLRQKNLTDRYREGIAYWDSNVVLNGNVPDYVYNNETVSKDANDYRTLQYLDLLCYLPDDILVKVDRASMANSLEVRVPMLDHEVVEYAFQLPHSINMIHPDGKAPLRNVLAKYIPEDLINRKKMGFAVPIAKWLNGELREWAEDLLSEAGMHKDGYFDVAEVHETWMAHKKEEGDYSFKLWGILMFQSWLRQNNELNS